MRSTSLALCAAFSLLLPVSQGHAQAGLREGARVRITAPGTPRTTGLIQLAGPDSIFVFAEPNGGKIGFSRASITQFQVSQGKSASRGALKGAMWGGGVGVLLGGFGLLMANGDPNFETTYDVSSRGEFFVGNVIGSILFGAGIGALVKSEKWETLDLHPTVSMGSAGLRVAFSFR